MNLTFNYLQKIMEYQKYLLPPHPKWMFLIAVPFLIIGGLLIVAGFIAVVAGGLIVYSEHGKNVFAGTLIGTSGILAITFGKIIFIFGQRFLAIKSEHELIKGFQPRILYLRSFKSEKKTKRILSIGRDIKIANLITLPDIFATTEEQILSGIFQKVGTPVAVGHPNEKLPLIGIPRIYLGDNWKEVVKELISDVEWVFIRADVSDGLWSEIEFAVSLMKEKPERLVFIIPFADDQGGFDKFREKLQKLVPNYCQIPYVYGSKVRGVDLTGLLYFDHEWKSKIINISEIVSPLGQNKVVSIKRILEIACSNIPDFETNNVSN